MTTDLLTSETPPAPADRLSDCPRKRNNIDRGVVSIRRAGDRLRRYHVLATSAQGEAVARVETACSIPGAISRFCAWWEYYHPEPPVCVRIEPFHPGKHNVPLPERSA